MFGTETLTVVRLLEFANLVDASCAESIEFLGFGIWSCHALSDRTMVRVLEFVTSVEASEPVVRDLDAANA